MTVGRELCVRLITDRARIPLSRDQWNALVGRNETNTVFQTFEWFDSWWSTFGDAHELFLLVAYHADVVVGFAALMLTRGVAGMRQLEFVGTGNADYQDIVAAPQDKRQVVAAICAFLRSTAASWHRAWLCNVPGHSTTWQYLQELGRPMGLFLVREVDVPCPAMMVEGERDAARQQIDKYSMRRPLNWFSKRGAVRFRHVEALPEIEALLPKLFDQHIRRWAAVGKPSLFTDLRQRKLYAALAQSMHQRGSLLFSVVELDGAPIAFHFGFDHERRITWYKPAFEVQYAEHSPGLLLIRYLIEDALRRERSEIDFTIGDEAFKGRFANVQRRNIYVGAYRSRLIWLASLALRNGRRKAGQLLRRLRKAG